MGELINKLYCIVLLLLLLLLLSLPLSLLLENREFLMQSPTLYCMLQQFKAEFQFELQLILMGSSFPVGNYCT